MVRPRPFLPFEGLEPRRFFAAHVVGDATVYATIQAAVDAALPGGIVTVDAGAYAEQVFVTKKLTIQGARAGVDARRNDRGVGESILTGQLDNNGLITGGFKIAANDVTIDGFTVQGQTTWTDTDGAGIVIRPNINGTKVFNNIVQNNVAGLYLANNSATNPAIIRGNVFRNNNNDGNHSGRGIYTNGGLTGGNLVNVTIDNNAFLYNTGSPNTTTTVEAGISLQTLAENAQSDIRITNNVFDQGGKAILFFNVSNSLFEGNTVTYMRDQWSGALRFEGGCNNITIRNNTLYGITGPAIRIDNKAVPGPNFAFVINGNNFYGNGYNTLKEALVVNGDQYTGYLDARNNWWNSPSGPSGSFAGTGEQVQANGNNIDVSGWATTAFARPNLGYLGVRQVTDTIIQFEEFDHGGRGIAYNDDTKREGNSKYRQPQTVDINTTGDTGGGVHVQTVRAGEWLQYSIDVLTSGVYDFAARVANSVTGGKFRVEIDGVNVSGSITVPATGGSAVFKTITTSGLNLTAGHHILRIVFEGNGGNFNWFKLTNTTPPPPTPNAPANLGVSVASAKQINVVWQDKSGNETGFAIERKTGANGVWEIVKTTAAGVTSWADTTVAPETSYTYRVRALGSAGDSAYSNESSAVTPAIQTTFFLSDLPFVGTPVNGWGPVERDMSVGGSSAGDGQPITLNGVVYNKGLGVHANAEILFDLNGNYATFLSDIGVDDKQQFNGSVVFQVWGDGVKLFDSGVMGASSATQSINVNVTGVQQLKLVVTDSGDGTAFDHADWANARLLIATPAAPSAPTGLATSAASATKIDLTWNDVAQETGYRIERSLDGITFVSVGTVASGVTAWSDTTVTGSTQYFYRVIATSSAGDSAASNTATATTPATPVPPSAPTGLGASAGSASKIDLTWTDASDNETGFVIERSLNGIDGWTTIATLAANATTYSDTAVAAGTQYHYRIRATNGGTDSANSNVATATTPVVPTAPAAPSGLAAAPVSQTQINLTWTDASNNETGFVIERSLNGVDGWTQIATPAANATSYSDSSGLAAGTKYHYRVRAVNGVGPSADSNVASATTLAAPTAPAAPTGFAASAASSSKIDLTWTDASNNETGFVIERSLNGIDGWIQVATPAQNATSYSDSGGLAASTKYFYRIRAINAVGPSGDSGIVNATTLANTPAPAWTSGDIGAVGTPGSSSESGGVHTVKGAGTDIWGNADSFHYRSQQLSGDGQIVVRVSSFAGGGDLLAKAGIMFRDGLGANAKQVGLFVTPGGGLRFIRRTTTGGASTSTAVTGPKAPYWLKLVRSGDTFTAYSSTNGTTWTTVGSTTVTMASTIHVGMAVTSKKTTTLATATFDNVSVGPVI